MSFIQPSGEIRILKGYTGDKGYNHTVRFDSRIKQYEYFTALVGASGIADIEQFNLTQQKYTNYTARSIRVPYSASTYFSCNYLMFRSTKGEVYEQYDRWYYAFIDSVEYVNNNMCEIFYTLDIIQSWYFDYKLTSCFVEREHSLTDNLFEHHLEEDLECGEYVLRDSKFFDILGEHIDYKYTSGDNPIAVPFTLSGFSYIIVATEVPNSEGLPPGYSVTVNKYSTSSGVPLPFSYIVCNDITSFYGVIEIYRQNNTLDSIVTVLLARNYFRGFESDDGVPSFEMSKEEAVTLNIPTTIGNYTPKNKKLFNFPFMKVVVNNLSGSNIELRPELFSGNNFYFKFVENIVTDVMSFMVPLNYAGRENNTDYAIIFNNYPNITWSKEALGSWLIANRNQINASLQNAKISMFTNFVTGAGQSIGGSTPESAGVNAIQGVSSSGANRIRAEIDYRNTIRMIEAKKKDLGAIPPQASANSLNSTLSLSKDIPHFGFLLGIYTPTDEYVQNIDDYFSLFGYSVNRVKVPNLALTEATLRPRWNYLKTLGCHVISSSRTYGLPAEIASQINAIYDKGITFWNTEYNGQSVSMYNYDEDNYAQPQTRRIDE